MARLRILVVDPDDIWRRGFRQLVQDHAGWEVSGEAIDAAAAIRLLIDDSPDVVAIDASFSLATIERIQRLRPDSAVVVLGSHERHEVVRGLLQAGVLGLVSKSEPAETIQQAIQAASNKELFVSPGASELVIEQYLSASTRHGAPGASARTLTSREGDVVRLLAEGKTNREAARELDISVKTVENHRANAMRKLGARSVGDLVRAAIRAGLIEN